MSHEPVKRVFAGRATTEALAPLCFVSGKGRVVPVVLVLDCTRHLQRDRCPPHPTRRTHIRPSEATDTARGSINQLQAPAHPYEGARTHPPVLTFPISKLRFQRHYVR